MQNSKLINNIKKLSINNIEGIKNLLQSNLIIKGSYRIECQKLISYIHDHYDNLEADALSKDIVSKILFQTNQPNINRLEKVMSSLLTVIEFYIVHFRSSENTNTKIHHNLALSKYYRQNELQQRSDIFILESMKYLEPKDYFLDTNYFYLKTMVSEERLVLDWINNKVINQNQYLDTLLQFKAFALLREIDLIYKIVYRTLVFSEQINKIFASINEQIKENDSDHPHIELLKIYQYAILMLQHSRSDEFYDYFELFLKKTSSCRQKLSKEVYNQFAVSERISITLRYNFQPNKINMQNLLNTLKKHLSEGLLFVNDRIVGGAATNIVMYSTKLKQNEWAEYFLETYKDKIGYLNENKEEIIALCWSIYYFANEEFENAEKHILPKYTNIYDTLLSRRMRIKIYFETNEFDLMSYDIESYKQFIYRHFEKKEINEDHYDANRLFLDRLKQILKLKFNPNTGKKKKLIEKVEGQKCSDQDWLIEKLQAIKV